jgi:GrpB-like predicted nucleotidyltransferase (UPF0157 family)
VSRRRKPSTVAIVAYDPAWPGWFTESGRELRAGLGGVARRTHVHVRRAGSFSEQWALLFRDYLRAHPEVAAEYGTLKRRLSREVVADGPGRDARLLGQLTDAHGSWSPS